MVKLRPNLSEPLIFLLTWYFEVAFRVLLPGDVASKFIPSRKVAHRLGLTQSPMKFNAPFTLTAFVVLTLYDESGVSCPILGLVLIDFKLRAAWNFSPF
jgi:hypothetical protein